MIAASVAACLLFAFLYLLQASPQYVSSSTVLIDVPKSKLDQTSAEQPLTDYAVGSQIELMRSERVIERVVRAVGEPEFGPQSLLGQLARWLNPGPAELNLRKAIETATTNLLVQRIGQSHVLKVSYVSVDANRSARVTNAVVEAYFADIRETFEQSTTQSTSWLASQLPIAKSKVSASEKAVEDAKTASKQMSVSAYRIMLTELETIAQSNRSAYESLLQRHAQSLQVQNAPISTSRLIDAARPPLSKSAPRTGITLIFSCLLGLVLGTAAALAADYFAPGFRSTSELEAELSIPVFGALPSVPHPTASQRTSGSLARLLGTGLHVPVLASAKASWRHAIKLVTGSAKSAFGSGLPATSSTAVVVRSVDASPVEYRADRARVPLQRAIEGGGDVGPHLAAELPLPVAAYLGVLLDAKGAIDALPNSVTGRTIGVVSSAVGEGRTTICTHLGKLISAAGASVVLVDADWQNASLSSALGLSSSAGLFQYLSGGTAPRVTEWKHGVNAIPAGVTPCETMSLEDAVRAAAQSTSARMPALMAELSRVYDYVIICFPPLGMSSSAAAAVAWLEGFILVVEANRTPRDEVHAALTKYPAVKQKTIGAILNKV